jgi:hypothetical protein
VIAVATIVPSIAANPMVNINPAMMYERDAGFMFVA